MINDRDKSIVRELAKKYMALVTSEKQARMCTRFRDTNDLKATRPPLILEEIPWYQMNMNGELDCVCENEKARGVEYFFRRAIFYMTHFKADNLYLPEFRIKRAVRSSGIGIEFEATDLKRTDAFNNIVSREYRDVLEDESALEKMHDPTFELCPEKDAVELEFHTELLGDSIPIKLFGFDYFYYAPWDKITRLRGVEPILMDMYDRPEYLHAIMKKYISATTAELDFVEKNLDVDNSISDLHRTPAKISGLADKGLKATWYRGMAQAFGVVSPEMFKEFELDYIKPIAERFAYTYYGCCEPLERKISVLKSIPNLRKLGCSPWADIESCAEQIGGDYVLSRKPTPANVAIKTDTEVVRREIEETVKTCIKYGCPYDYVLKDISTVSNNPQNLIIWSEIVNEVLNKYYGEE